jgi:hypothetical protein
VQVRPALARTVPGRGQSFHSFLAEYQPLAQVSGSYFSLSSWAPVGDIVINGRLRYGSGGIGSALLVRPDNTAKIVNIPRGWLSSWQGYEMVLRGGVRLVQDGKYAVYPHDQGFRDPALFRQATRTAVGITPQQRLLLVAVGRGIQLSQLAAIMKALGCRDAMTLDGGTSTGLAYGTSVIFTPGRLLSNVLMVVERPAPAPTPPVKKRTGQAHILRFAESLPWPAPVTPAPRTRLLAGPPAGPVTSVPEPVEEPAPPDLGACLVCSRFAERKVALDVVVRRKRTA